MRKNILIIDDDSVFRNSLGKIFEAAGYDVLLAKNGEEGLEMFREDLPDLIIADLLMPKMNGAELVKKIRGYESGENIPVVMMTGVRITATLERDAKIKWGVNALLPKGVDIEKIIQKVEEFIGPGS